MDFRLLSTRAVGSSKLYLQQHGPGMLTAAGVIGFGITTALAIRQTAKAEGTLKDIKANVDTVKMNELGRSEEDRRRELVRVYVKSAVKLAEHYWPVALAGTASAICVISGHGLMARRQSSLIAAYTALDAGYKAYRKKVQEELGEDKERELYRQLKMDIAEASGRPLCEMDEGVDPSLLYTRFFDHYNPNWTKTAEYNLFFLRQQQTWAQERLNAYGYLYLNEVLEALGFERTQAGQVVGWRLDGDGDGYVDFGLFEFTDESKRQFINGAEHVVLLDFNVDGPIWIS